MELEFALLLMAIGSMRTAMSNENSDTTSRLIAIGHNLRNAKLN
jgi:hypothetical protein